MTSKKIGRRQLLRLLPACILAAGAAVVDTVSVTEETVEVGLDVDYERLAAEMWDTPLVAATEGEGIFGASAWVKPIVNSERLGAEIWDHSTFPHTALPVTADFDYDIIKSSVLSPFPPCPVTLKTDDALYSGIDTSLEDAGPF